MKVLLSKFANPIGCIKFYEDFSGDTPNYILRVQVVDIDHNYKRQIDSESKEELSSMYYKVVNKLTEIYEGMQTHAEKIDRILSRQ